MRGSISYLPPKVKLNNEDLTETNELSYTKLADNNRGKDRKQAPKLQLPRNVSDCY